MNELTVYNEDDEDGRTPLLFLDEDDDNYRDY